MEYIIDIDDLSFSYGRKEVISHLDLKVPTGEVLCVLGPNGVGKTTLIENILGSLRPSSGRVRVLGHDPIAAPRSFWSEVSLVQQHWSDHSKWRVKDQLEWIRAAHTTQRHDLPSTDEVLSLVGLADKADLRLSRLSGGQRRSVDFAAALLTEPTLLILDEPTAGLDPRAKARIHDLISEQQDRASTVLMTTHDLSEAERIADRIIILDQGGIVSDGSPAQLRADVGKTAQIAWTQDGRSHVHSTPTPERFLQTLDLNAVSDLSVTRPSLEDAYLQIVHNNNHPGVQQ